MQIPDTVDPGVACCLSLPGVAPIHAYVGAGSVELETPITSKSVFNVGSVAKQIVAHIAIAASRNGLIGLRDPVAKYLPQVKIPGVQVSELINHQSGIRDAESLLSLAGFRQFDHYTSADLFTLAVRQETRAVSTGTFLYSNTNYLILTRLIESVYGTEINDIAESQVFGPSGMKSARFKADPQTVIPHAVPSYTWDGAKWNVNVTTVTLAGPGSLWCTVDDLNAWLAYLYSDWQREGTVLPKQRLVPYVSADQSGYRYGAGLYAREHSKTVDVFHYGHENGFSAAVQLGSSGAKIICMSNSSRFRADHILNEVSKSGTITMPDVLVKTILATQKEQCPNLLTRTNDTAEHEPLGTFTSRDVPGSVRISRKGQELFLWRRGTADRLEPLCQTGTRYGGPGYKLTTNTNLRTNNNVLGFTLDLQRAPNLVYRRKG